MEPKSILITGGCGFIGSHVIRHFVKKYPEYKIVNMDCLTYAGNPDNLKDIWDSPNYKFVNVDICSYEDVLRVMVNEGINGVIHLAAESHVDNSIKDPFKFVRTNVMGTMNLLHIAKTIWKKNDYNGNMFYHISTDEVYGALEMNYPKGFDIGGHHVYGSEFFTEETKYDPHSPYSASKASSDHFVRAYHDTYGLPTVISNCSNNYGPYQYPEKLIPLFINNILEGKDLPVYGKGLNVRDWLYVEDHVDAIDLIFHKGKSGETYNIGGFNEWRNIDLVKLLVKTVDEYLGNPVNTSYHLIRYVDDRLGHDVRYAIDSSKLQWELGWAPKTSFKEGIKETVKWYLNNKKWLENLKKSKNIL